MVINWVIYLIKESFGKQFWGQTEEQSVIGINNVILMLPPFIMFKEKINLDTGWEILERNILSFPRYLTAENSVYTVIPSFVYYWQMRR